MCMQKILGFRVLCAYFGVKAGDNPKCTRFQPGLGEIFRYTKISKLEQQILRCFNMGQGSPSEK